MSTALITGANRGIGFELARQLVERGDQVIAACRTPSAELQALGCRIEAGVDVGSDDLGGLAERLGGESIDLLINNAGILGRTSLDDLDFEAMRRQFEINAIGPLRVSAALLENLKPGAKIGMVTSRMGSVTDNGSGSHYAYRMSKAALNIAGVSLAKDLAPRGIAVALLHPGWVRTRMTGHNGLIDADESARGLIVRMDELTMESSGNFWHTNGDLLPW